jgi:hypothetical protein
VLPIKPIQPLAPIKPISPIGPDPGPERIGRREEPSE